MAAWPKNMAAWPKNVVLWLKRNIFVLIALAVLASYVGVWWYIVREVLNFKATPEHPTVDIPTGIVQVAGLLGTTIATITASALGFNIAEVKADNSHTVGHHRLRRCQPRRVPHLGGQ
jgi:divalent metal cation (Fe/Co/Zn/Cd) transporter